MSERLEFVRLAESESVSFAELCRRFGVSRQTGYVWLRRFESDGMSGLVDRSRRPLHSPTGTDPVMEDLVVELRQEHPRWGGRKLNRVLTNRGYRRVPAPSTISSAVTGRVSVGPTASMNPSQANN
ncbi:MAG: helix-turn-helix domain-containing protein, partial [Actinobacteria bacterium]|nr:helix-turn-helix domain-containing protein [Actinomycetota bacterium]